MIHPQDASDVQHPRLDTPPLGQSVGQTTSRQAVPLEDNCDSLCSKLNWHKRLAKLHAIWPHSRWRNVKLAVYNVIVVKLDGFP
jgi:hypothetical protein